jgi:hypothetical protein
MRRWMPLMAAPAALIAGGSAPAASGTARIAQEGGLAVSPALLQAQAQPGPLGAMTVTNRSGTALAVTVTPRPWAQSAAGKVSADRRRTLALIRVSRPSFTLAPGAAQAVDLTLAGAPAGGSLYGAMEVIGVPPDAAPREGVVLGYRLIGSLRLAPARKKLALKAGAVKLAAKRTVVLPVTNAGNTLDPVSGTVKIKSARGTLNSTMPALRILPGKTVNIALSSVLKKGSYSATVTLKQGGTKLLTAKRRFSVR